MPCAECYNKNNSIRAVNYHPFKYRRFALGKAEWNVKAVVKLTIYGSSTGNSTHQPFIFYKQRPYRLVIRCRCKTINYTCRVDKF